MNNNKLILISFCLVIFSFFNPVLAGENHNEGGHDDDHPEIMNMEEMHTQMKDLKALMNKIHKTKDPKALQTLINSNMGTMMKGMELMDAMMILMMRRS